MTDDRLALMADVRLSGDARMMVLLLIEMGRGDDGWHEVPRESFRAVLSGGPSDETIRRHLRQLEALGWIESNTNTGRRPPQFRIVDRSKSQFRTLLVTAARELLPHTDEGQTALPHTHEGQTVSFPPHGCGPEAVSPTPTRGRSVPPPPPIPPPPPPLNARVREVVESDNLSGCRGSLGDYLVARVEEPYRLGYAQTVAGMIQGTDEAVWMARDGSHVREGRAQIIAGCLNEMLAGDEIGRYFPGPPGDVRNLRTKIRYQVKSITGAKNDARRRSTADPGAARGAPSRPTRQAPDVHVLR